MKALALVVVTTLAIGSVGQGAGHAQDGKKDKEKIRVETQSRQTPKRQLEQRYKVLDKETKMKLVKRLNGYMDDLVRMYGKDANGHERTAAQLLWYSNRFPIYWLEIYHDAFIAKVKRYGVGPFLSYYIDYGTRLAAISTRSSLRKYRQLKMLYKPDESRNQTRAVFIRNQGRAGFTKYSENVGWLVSMFLYSDIGEDYSTTGRYRGADYLKVVAILDSCRSKEDKEKGVPSAIKMSRLDTCALLVSGVQSKLRGQNFTPNDFSAALGDVGGRGFGTGTRSCLAGLGDDTFGQLVSGLEAYMACRASSRGVNPAAWTLISMMPYDGGFRRITIEGVEVGTKMETGNPLGGRSETAHYPRANLDVGDTNASGELWQHSETDAQGNVVYESSEFRGTTESGDTVTYSLERRTDPGSGTTTTTESTSIDGVGSVSSTKTTDSNGNVTSQSTSVTIEFDDGSSTTTTTTVDANGNVTETVTETPAPVSDDSGSEEDTATTQPVDDVIVDECAAMLNQRPDKGISITKIDTQIIPAVDSAPTDSAITACLGGTTPLTRCTSAWMCLEGTVDSQCRCTRRAASGSAPPPYGDVCRQITCNEGASCDPSTGTCTTGTGGSVTFEPPIPLPFDLQIGRMLDSLRIGIEVVGARMGNMVTNLRDSRRRSINSGDPSCGSTIDCD